MVMMIPTPCFTQDDVGTFDYDGIERLYHVYLPEDYQPNMPLVLVLHGYNAYPPRMDNYTRIHEYADSLVV